MIDPKAISPASLPSVALEDRASLPTEPCIYFAIDSQGVVQYIGRSVNPRSRWRKHHRRNELAGLGGVSIAYLFLDSSLHEEVEKALIHWFNPPMNGSRISDEDRDMGRVSMMVPESFYIRLKAESDCMGVSMMTFLKLYGDRMIAAIKG